MQCQPVSGGVKRSDAEAKTKMAPSQQKPAQPVDNLPSQEIAPPKGSKQQIWAALQCMPFALSNLTRGWVGWLRFLGKASKKGNGSSLPPLFCLCTSTENPEAALGELCIRCPLLPLRQKEKAPALVPSLIFPFREESEILATNKIANKKTIEFQYVYPSMARKTEIWSAVCFSTWMCLEHPLSLWRTVTGNNWGGACRVWPRFLLSTGSNIKP